jgi:hypothetical protein
MDCQDDGGFETEVDVAVVVRKEALKISRG